MLTVCVPLAADVVTMVLCNMVLVVPGPVLLNFLTGYFIHQGLGGRGGRGVVTPLPGWWMLNVGCVCLGFGGCILWEFVSCGFLCCLGDTCWGWAMCTFLVLFIVHCGLGVMNPSIDFCLAWVSLISFSYASLAVPR